MKNLANCTPKEFLVQTNKIKKSVETWLDLTKIKEIRKESPVLAIDATPEERKAAIEAQSKANFSKILDACLEENVDETVNLLGMLCFVEPKDVNKHTMTEYLGCVNELLGNQEVLSFFTSLMQLGQTVGFISSKG